MTESKINPVHIRENIKHRALRLGISVSTDLGEILGMQARAAGHLAQGRSLWPRGLAVRVANALVLPVDALTHRTPVRAVAYPTPAADVRDWIPPLRRLLADELPHSHAEVLEAVGELDDDGEDWTQEGSQ